MACDRGRPVLECCANPGRRGPGFAAIALCSFLTLSCGTLYSSYTSARASLFTLDLRHFQSALVPETALVFDALDFTHSHCFAAAFEHENFLPATLPRKIIDGAFSSWATVFESHARENGSVYTVPRASLRDRDCEARAVNPDVDRVIYCPCVSSNQTEPLIVSCTFSSDFSNSRKAEGVLLSHIGVSYPGILQHPQRMRALLWPMERTHGSARVWAMRSMYEPLSYYSAGRDDALLSQFEYTWGSYQKHISGAFQMSYLPNWSRLAQPVDWAAKAAMRTALNATAAVVWVASNCGSRSGREAFVRSLMTLLPVDSWGRCLNNRDPGPRGLLPDNSNWGLGTLLNKQELLRPYKFALVLENSVEEDYVSEKLFDAWAEGAVPLYLGAPNVMLNFSLGPDSLIDLTGMGVQEVADLVTRLDGDPVAYGQHHAWRKMGSAQLQADTPLGRTFELHARGNPECDICRLVHASRPLVRS